MPCLQRPASGCVRCRSRTRSLRKVAAKRLGIWRHRSAGAAMQRVNDALLLVGRLLDALFLPFVMGKAMGFAAFAATLASKGLPYSKAWAAAAVAIEVR